MALFGVGAVFISDLANVTLNVFPLTTRLERVVSALPADSGSENLANTNELFGGRFLVKCIVTNPGWSRTTFVICFSEVFW